MDGLEAISGFLSDTEAGDYLCDFSRVTNGGSLTGLINQLNTILANQEASSFGEGSPGVFQASTGNDTSFLVGPGR